MKTHVNPDTAALDWLETFGGSIEWDDVTGLGTVHPRERDYPPMAARSIRAAAARAMRAAMAVDARGAGRFRLVSR